MADAVFNTLVADVVVPEVFTPYVQQLTEEKTLLIEAGVLQRNAAMDQLLAGGGVTFQVPSWKDLDNDADNIATDATADTFGHILSGSSINLAAALSVLSDSRPKAHGTAQETAVRLNRNQSWASADLTADLAGEDPLGSVGARVAKYWSRRLQAIFVATVNGISKDNGANDSGDYAFEVVGTNFAAGVTDFSAEAFIDAAQTLGDSEEDTTVVMVHSVVYGRMQKNNLIEFVHDSDGKTRIPTFLGRRVVVDDGVPSGTGVVRLDGTAGVTGMYESWLFGAGAVQLGVGTPKKATAIVREEAAGNGGGQEVLYNRNIWSMHMVGHAYIGTSPNGGPDNTTATNMLNVAGSWNRVYTERKQIKFARLITRES